MHPNQRSQYHNPSYFQVIASGQIGGRNGEPRLLATTPKKIIFLFFVWGLTFRSADPANNFSNMVRDRITTRWKIISYLC